MDEPDPLRDRVEWLTVGRRPSPRHGQLGLLVGPAVIAALVIGIVSLVVLDRPEASAPAPAPPSASAFASTSAPRSPRPSTRRPDISVWTSARPMFGATGSWELYGRAEDAVVRVQPAAGVVTVIPVPRLDSTGPVSFLVTGDTAVIRPLDAVRGYQVHRGETWPLPQYLYSGIALPGPKPGQVWTADFSDEAMGVSLVQLRGSGAGSFVTFDVPPNAALASDGAGGFVARLGRRTVAYDGTRAETVPQGTLLAAGPRTWLVANCPTRRCRPTVVDRRTGQARTLSVRVDNEWMSGSVSPDGRYAALLESRGSAEAVRVLDLETGDAEQLRVRILSSAYGGSIAWSPDSEMLLMLDSAGQVGTYEPRRGVTRIGHGDLPPLRQLAIKP